MPMQVALLTCLRQATHTTVDNGATKNTMQQLKQQVTTNANDPDKRWEDLVNAEKSL